jgi:Flp pilus assembly protein TadD
MEEIYANKNEDVEVVHHYEEDVVVFDHEQTNHVQSLPSVIIEDHDVLSLELHPARALDVDLSNNPECRGDLDSGYFAIAKNSWAEAAIKFQKIASRMPGDSSVYNNYGLALLQRAIEMAKDGDESIQIMASSQFESAILALREAAKSAPGESTILLNLAHALLVSGRSEKAMKIIQVHNSKHPNSVEGANLEAAALVSLGQSVNAKAKLTKFKGDSIVDENLARLL